MHRIGLTENAGRKNAGHWELQNVKIQNVSCYLVRHFHVLYFMSPHRIHYRIGSSAPRRPKRITQPTSNRTLRRPPGRPRNKWLDQLRNDSTRPIGDLWRRAVDSGHRATTQRPKEPRNLV